MVSLIEHFDKCTILQSNKDFNSNYNKLNNKCSSLRTLSNSYYGKNNKKLLYNNDYDTMSYNIVIIAVSISALVFVLTIYSM